MTTSTPVLDRVPSRPDPRRSTIYSARQSGLIDPRGPRSYTWQLAQVLDQGREGACVGHGVTHEALATPKPVDFTRLRLPEWAQRTRELVLTWHATGQLQTPATPVQRLDAAQAFAFDAYDRARDVDYWPGRDYDGTSADAGAKVMREAGLWEGWAWASTEREFATIVSRQGPAGLACNWYTGMMRPDRAGYLEPSGSLEGGHYIVVLGYQVGHLGVRPARYVLANSWGPEWGQRGRCYLRADHLDQLRDEDGELLVPLGRRL